MLDGPPVGLTCLNCKKRPASKWFSDNPSMAVRTGIASPWCERCVIEKQLEYAREHAAEIPKLEDKLLELDGLELAIAEVERTGKGYPPAENLDDDE